MKRNIYIFVKKEMLQQEEEAMNFQLNLSSCSAGDIIIMKIFVLN